MNFAQASNFLYTHFFHYQEQGMLNNFSLAKINTLCHYIHHPEKKFKSIHIAGTNGKGSTAHALAAVLQTAGYKTGLFTSPHFHCFRERISVQGKKIDKKFVAAFITLYQDILQKVNPSFFEVNVMMAFAFFAQNKVDIALIEVGMGGSLDATNIILPEIAIITHIGLDHTAILGNTLEKIATEKAGIIKKNVPTIVGDVLPDVMSVFQKIAQSNKSLIYEASHQYYIQNLERNCYEVIHQKKKQRYRLEIDVKGHYMQKNLPTILLAIDILNQKNFFITHQQVKQGLKSVCLRTNLRGRWEICNRNPMVIADVAHNIAGIQIIQEQLKAMHYHQLHIVWGMVQKENAADIMFLLPKNARYYFCMPSISRALPKKDILKIAKKYQLIGNYYTTVNQAYNTAKKQAKAKDLILITGSTFVVAEVLK